MTKKKVASSKAADADSLGATLRAAREAAGMTLTEVAAKAPVSASHLCNIELGKAMPGTRTLSRIAKVLGLRLEVSFPKVKKEGK